MAPQPTSSVGLAGIDRKAMEAARLSRAARYIGPPDRTYNDRTTAPISPPRPAKKPRILAPPVNPYVPSDETLPRPEEGYRYFAAPVAPFIVPEAPPPKAYAFGRPPAPILEARSRPLQYPYGVIKRTWCRNQPRSNDVTFDEVLQSSTLKTAIMSAWQLDFDWLFSRIPPTAKTILVMHSKHEEDMALWRSQIAHWSKTFRLCFPPLGKGAFGTMHSKLMLLFHETHMRIVVPSANLVPYDWGETGIMENSVFMVDLPRLPPGLQGQVKDPPPFARQLTAFLEAQGIDSCMPESPTKLTSALRNFDFSRTSHLAFVHTIAGHHYGEVDAMRTGWPLLSRSVRELGLQMEEGEELEVDYATSSLGALTEERVKEFHDALRGVPVRIPTPSVPKQNTPSKGQQALSFVPKPTGQATSPTSDQQKALRMRIHFPTLATILASQPHGAGPPNAGTICLQPSTWCKPTFPRHYMHGHTSKRGQGVLSHNKLIFCRASYPTKRAAKEKLGNRQGKAFVYIGSANFSSSAWGTLSFVKSKNTVSLAAANWECGVLMRVSPTHPSKAAADVSPDDESTDSEAGEGNDESTNVDAGTHPEPVSPVGEQTQEEKRDEREASDCAAWVVPLDVFEKAGVPVPFVVPDTPYMTDSGCTEPWMQQQQHVRNSLGPSISIQY